VDCWFNFHVTRVPDAVPDPQRCYAHRSLRDLFVYEFEALNAAQPCTLSLTWRYNASASPDLAIQDGGTDLALWNATTLLPELPGGQLRSIGVAFDPLIRTGPSIQASGVWRAGTVVHSIVTCRSECS
jgi:hypothetical protein